jgi:soluble lytic murein transglycosylase-like protein
VSKEFYIVGAALGIAAGVSLLWYYHYAKAQASLSFTPTDGAAGTTAADTDTTAGNIEADVTAALAGWESVGSAADWIPYINAAEASQGIPANLLARMAYEESHFREEIIRGTKVSSAGALGILQLEPAYFSSVQAPIPFTDDDVRAQIDEAASDVARLYSRFSSWSLTLAAYNAGEGNVHKYGGIPPFPETQKYVSDISADVPGLA